jgi:hypothetical protein
MSMQSAPLGAAQKAAQLQEEIPDTEPTLLSEKERHGNILGLKHAPPSHVVGVMAPPQMTDANLGAVALESSLTIKNSTPTAT